MTMKGQQQHYQDGIAPQQSTPSGYVNPRIQAIERRMQLRTPDSKSRVGPRHPQHQQQQHVPSSNNNPSGGNNNSDMITPKKKKGISRNANDNHALVLHSPILSSILPNSNIKQFESDVLKRQAEHTARISDLEGRLALFHTRLAVECAERGREHAFTMEEYVNGPLEQAVRRSYEKMESDFVRPIMDPKRATAILTGGSGGSGNGSDNSRREQSSASGNESNETVQGDSKNNDNKNNNNAASNTNQLPNLVAIERRTNLLEAQMNHHAHVTLFHSKRQNYDAVDKTCRQTLQPQLSLEMTKADKREGHMARRFESSSGEYTRLVSEMTSARVASLGYIEMEIDGWDLSDVTRAEHYLEEIQKLKRRVLEEREERIRRDELVVEEIVKSRNKWEEDIFMASDL